MPLPILKRPTTGLKKEADRLSEERRKLEEHEKQITETLQQTDRMIDELVGAIRVNAKDVDALISQNPQTAVTATSVDFSESIAQNTRFPGMEDVRNLAQGLLDQIDITGQVGIQNGPMVDRTGREVAADLLLVGPFTVAYRTSRELGFCNYSTSGKKLYALSRLPSNRMQKQLARYMEGKTDVVPMDISRGGALRQLTHELKLWEQIPHGGPIVWPILGIFAIGVLIVLERIVFLVRKKLDSDSLMRKIEGLCADNDWDACQQVCRCHRTKPVARVVDAGLRCCHMQREEMENALQEAILREIPPMERFLSTLGMLAAIAPLLGLLGTVTGMIDTFHVITLHGTGDPRLMSGGISEALVTTMMGLSVAIPLMLSQTLLSRAVDKKIGDMEEKAVSLVNIIHKNREAS